MIRVLLAEDQAMVLGALAALLALESDIEVVGRATDGAEALALVRETNPHVVVADVEMPKMTGIDLAAAIRAERLAAKVIIVTTFARGGYLRRAMDAGAAGYLLKASPATQLADAVRRVSAGGRAIDPALATEAWAEPDPLSERERQVLRLAGEGLRSPDIASMLNLSEGTVRNYLSEAMAKLDATTRIEAARIARDKGWL